MAQFTWFQILSVWSLWLLLRDGAKSTRNGYLSLAHRWSKNTIKEWVVSTWQTMLIALYRITVKTRRWYIKVFWHCIDICKVNAWILYRRHCAEQGIPKKNQKSLLKFVLELADMLISVNKAAPSDHNLGKAGRPQKRKSLEVGDSKLGRKPVTPSPYDAVRTDQYGHWPIFQDKGRCRKCKTGYSRVFCSKCKICLCLTSQRNCFLEFHDGL